MEHENCSCEQAEEKELIPELVRLIAGAAAFGAGVVASALHAGFYITTVLFILSLTLTGAEVLFKAVRNIFRGEMFDENLLMSIASVGACVIGQFEEGAAVMLFNCVGEYLQDAATRRSRKSIIDLMDLRPDYANLVTEQGIRRVAPQEVAIGGLIEIRPGEKVPLDGVVTNGRSFLDTSGLTGEPVPLEIAQGGRVTGGFINGDGVLTVRVDKAFGESTVSRIIDLIENASAKKAKAENFITRFAKVYTPAVTVAALLIAVMPPLLLSMPFRTWIYRALIFLVVSCPCALVVSVPLGFFAGIGAASYKGILVKGGNYLEMLSRVDTVVFDKTGTLTKGVFEVVKIIPANPEITPEQLLSTAALAECRSNHPIAKSILKACGGNPQKPDDAEYEETAGMGIKAVFGDRQIIAGNEKLMLREMIPFERYAGTGTAVYAAENGAYLGCIVISDIVKAESAAAIEGLRRLGIKKTVMLSGDRRITAEAIAAGLKIDEVYAELLPDQKVAEFEKIAGQGNGMAAFVGDGINDAPVLARSDVGIAMGGAGSDAAVEAADIVIMNDDPSRLVSAVRISKYVKKIVWQNIILALGVKFIVLLLASAGFASIWAAVFADTGVALLAVANSLRVLILKKRF